MPWKEEHTAAIVVGANNIFRLISLVKFLMPCPNLWKVETCQCEGKPNSHSWGKVAFFLACCYWHTEEKHFPSCEIREIYQVKFNPKQRFVKGFSRYWGGHQHHEWKAGWKWVKRKLSTFPCDARQEDATWPESSFGITEGSNGSVELPTKVSEDSPEDSRLRTASPPRKFPSLFLRDIRMTLYT